MSIRVVHTADVHYCREHRQEALESLRVVRDTVSEHGADLVVVAGDLFDRGLQASDRDGIPELLQVISEIMDSAPVVAVYGTPTHDVPGSYEVLTHLNAGHGFWMLYPDTKYFLCEDGQIHTETDYSPAKALILGCQEPGKDWLLANKSGLGSAEATEAANEAMRGLLLGLGSMRREHPDIPCVMVYHGAVRGATMGSGQVVGSGELAIGAEDLATVGADYYALGHIHMSQAVGEGTLIAGYSGSVYPKDWGELDAKCFTEVEILGHGLMPVISLTELPHPARRKIVTTVAEGIDDFDVAGVQVWLVVRDTADAIARTSEKELRRWLVDVNRAHRDSRITLEVLPTETVRAEEISEADGLEEKLGIFAEAQTSPVELTRELLGKASSLEEAAREEGSVAGGARIRIRHLSLRGAIGIWKGLREDEVVLDLDATGEGLVALVGPNGAGKSTLIENLHPYPQMLTRGGSLQSHFRLKDSWRQLAWIDEATCTEYRAAILIDATLATPKAEYHLYQLGEDGWFPLTNGRKEEYLEKITELWGSIDLFVRSAFVAQKPPKGHPDLAEATPAERKALFRELGGLDYLQTYAEMAKAKAESFEAEIRSDEARADVLRPLLAGEDDKVRDLATAVDRLSSARKALSDITLQGVEKRKEVEALADAWKAQEVLQRDLDRLTRDARSFDTEERELRVAMGRAAVAREDLAEAERTLQLADDLAKAEGVLREEETDVLRERDRIQADYGARVAAVRSARDKVQATIRVMEQRIADLGKRKASAVTSVDALTARVETPIEDTCPTCGQTLPAARRAELLAEVVRLKGELEDRQQEVLTLDNATIEAEREVEAQEAELAGLVVPEAPAFPTFSQAEALEAVLSKRKTIDIEGARRTQRAAHEAAATILSAEKRLSEISGLRASIETTRQEIEAKLDPRAKGRYQDAEEILSDLRTLHADASRALGRLEAETKALEDSVRDLRERRAELTRIEDLVEAQRKDLDEWRYLERACGRDGIQALELDAMGPGIASAANGLLDAAYGSRFRLEIRTTRIAGKGSKTKQVEDFEIIVHDTERGTEQPMDTLSGGETVWIRKALYDAFGIIRARATGTQFLTAMLDEADGALDPEARMRYVAMLKAAHLAAGRRHTIVITHSEAAQEAIEHRVEMGELVGTLKEAVA